MPEDSSGEPSKSSGRGASAPRRTTATVWQVPRSIARRWVGPKRHLQTDPRIVPRGPEVIAISVMRAYCRCSRRCGKDAWRIGSVSGNPVHEAITGEPARTQAARALFRSAHTGVGEQVRGEPVGVDV